MARSRIRFKKLLKFSRQILIAGAMVLAIGFAAPVRAQSDKMVQLPIQVPPVIQRSQWVSHKSATDVVHVNISLLPPNSAALQAFADSVSDPNSPNYRKFATPAQLGQMFGQPQATVQKIVDYLHSKGFKVTLVGDSRLNIMADATVAQAEAAFNTTINNYHAVSSKEPNRIDYYSFNLPLQLPPTIAPSVLAVSGLDNIAIPHPQFKKVHGKKVKFASTPLTPTQTRVLYNTAPLYNAGMQGNKMNVAISNWDGYRLSNVPLYYKQFNLPTPAGGVGSNVKVVLVDGGGGAGTPQGEGDLDIQMVLGMAPLSNFTVYDGGGGLTNVLTKEQNDNAVDIISESYGWNLQAADAIACHNLHVLMTAQGITYMAATGDSGTTLEPYAYSDYDPEVLKVGGTIASVDSTGNRLSEVGWSGGGGGWATESVSFNTLPSWQKGKGVPTTINYRLNPDVALNAAGPNNTGAYQFFYNGAIENGYIGTSFASPVFAGALAISEQKIGSTGVTKRLGRVMNVIYKQNGRSDVWFDVSQGNNGTLPNGQPSNAGPFWDFVTGWGAVDFTKYASTAALAPPQVFNVNSIIAYVNTALRPPVIEGTNPTGSVGNLTATDGVVFGLTPVLEPAIGKISAMDARFLTTVDPTKVISLAFNVSGIAPAPATVMVYVKNQVTGAYEVLQSVSGTAFGVPSVANVTSATLANYFTSTGQVQAMVRCLVPNSRLGLVGNFVFKLDQLQLSVGVATAN